VSTPDFRTSLQMASVAMHEVFLTLLQAGFTEGQALRLVGFLVQDMTETDN